MVLNTLYDLTGFSQLPNDQTEKQPNVPKVSFQKKNKRKIDQEKEKERKVNKHSLN